MSVDINGLLLHLERLHPSYNALHWPPAQTSKLNISPGAGHYLFIKALLALTYLRKTEEEKNIVRQMKVLDISAKAPLQ